MRYPIMPENIAGIYAMCAAIKRDRAKTQIAKDRLDQAEMAMLGLEPATWDGKIRELKTYRNVTRRMGF